MQQSNQVVYRKYDGPNLIVPHAAAIAEFTSPFDKSLPASIVQRAIGELLPPEMQPPVRLPDGEVLHPRLAGLLSDAWQDVPGENGLPVNVESIGAGRWRIALGFHDAEVAFSALQAGIEFANAIFTRAAGAFVNERTLRAIGERMNLLSRTNQPDRISRLLIRVARARDIPVYRSPQVRASGCMDRVRSLIAFRKR